MLFIRWLFRVFLIFICDLRLCRGTESQAEIDFQKLRQLIQEGDDIVELKPQRDIVLLFGMTGADKSTLGLLLTGDNRYLTAVRYANSHENFYIVDTNTLISSSELPSQIIFPEKMVDTNGTVYYDCPGYIDTKSLIHDAAATHFVRRVIESAERVKFVLVIDHEFLFSWDFVDFMVHTASYVRNINVFRDGIALIVTKVNNSLMPEKTEIIAEYLMSIRSNHNHTLHPLALQLIDILLHKSGDQYTKIGTMQSPKKPGALSDNKSIQENKVKVKNLIENNLKFIVRNASDLTECTVSKSQHYCVAKLMENLIIITGKLNKFYEQQENELTNVFQFTNFIRQHVELWDLYHKKNCSSLPDCHNELRTYIHLLNITFCDENLKKMSMQIQYTTNNAEHAALWKTLLEAVQKRINEMMRWYDKLLQFHQLLASYEVQYLRPQLLQIYGYRNTNLYNQLQAMQNSTNLEIYLVQNQIKELSVNTSDHRKSLIHDIWDNSMQPVSKTIDSKTNTLRIQGFILTLREVIMEMSSFQTKKIKNFEIFALDTIFIDYNFRLSNAQNLVIIAPVWIVKGNRSIKLNGYVTNFNYPSCNNVIFPGNFLGISFEIQVQARKMLNISADFMGMCGDLQLVIESPKFFQSAISIQNCNHSQSIVAKKWYSFTYNACKGNILDNYLVKILTDEILAFAINKATAVKNYKFILRASLNKSGKHKNIQQIKNLLEKIGSNQEITKFYGVEDLVDELIGLETQCQELDEIDCIDFFESLLRQVQNFPGDGSSNTKRALTYLTTAIFTKIHNFRSGFDNYLVNNINEYLKLIGKSIQTSLKQTRLTLATVNYQKNIADRIDEAQAFITSLIRHDRTRLEEMKVNVIRSQGELKELIHKAIVKADELKRRNEALESDLKTMQITESCLSIFSSLFTSIPYIGGAIEKSILLAVPENEIKRTENEIMTIKTDIKDNDRLLEATIKHQEKFDYKLTPLLAKFENEIRENNLNNRNKSQIGLEESRFKLTSLFIEINHYLEKIPIESAQELHVTVKNLEFVMKMMLDISDRVHTYNQQSELAVYLHEIVSDTTEPNPLLTQLERFIKTNLICIEYKKAIKAITLFAFPFADIYLADLQPRNLCDNNTFNSSSLEMTSIAHTQIAQLSNRIMKSEITVNNQLDKHIIRAFFNNISGIGPFYRWSNAENRDSIRKLLAGDEVIFTSEITRTSDWRMAVKFNEIGIAIRTHSVEMQWELDEILAGYGMTMKHIGYSYYRWRDEFYVIASDTSVQILKSFRECSNATNSCYGNEAYYKLKDGNASLSPYTMWTLKLRSETASRMKFNELQRFVDHVDIELEGTGTFVDPDIKLDQNLISKYYRKYIVNNNIN